MTLNINFPQFYVEISDCAEPHVHEGAAEARGAEPSTGCAAMAG